MFTVKIMTSGAAFRDDWSGLYRFDTQAERDKWVSNQYDRHGYALAVKCTRAIVEKKLGRDFLVTSDGLYVECW